MVEEPERLTELAQQIVLLHFVGIRILVVHGGGWLNGYKDKFRALTLALAKRGYVTAAIEYRLGYEEKFPAGIHDCFSAVDFLFENAEKFGIDRSRIGAVGGSAGADFLAMRSA